MKDYQPAAIRNVCLIGHGQSGKTSLCESVLYSLKAIDRMGSVDEGTSHSDFTKDEISRKHSISASLLTASTKEVRFNLIDTPGFSDFLGEVNGALRVSDMALVTIHGVAGIEVVTEQVWERAEEAELPRAFFVNLLDKENADFEKVLGQLEEAYPNAAPMQYAVNCGPGFNQIIDLLSMKLYTYENGKASASDIPGNLQDKADELREKLIERVAEADDELMEKFFEEGSLTDEEMVKGMKTGIKAGAIFPVLCGAATSQVGIDKLTAFFETFGPTPLDRPVEKAQDKKTGEEVEVVCDPAGKISLLIYKTTTEAHVGEMSYFRVFSGALTAGVELTNNSGNGSEKISQVAISLGKERKTVDQLNAGDMGVLVKLKSTKTGDTLAVSDFPVILAPPKFPEPSIRGSVVPKTSGEEDKISEGLNILQKADPTFVVTFDPELSQTILAGQGDAQLAVVLSRLKDRFGVDAELVEPKIPYRETIRKTAEAEGKHKKQSGGRGQFGIANIRVEPQPRGEGYEFVDAIVGGVIPRQFIPAVDKGCQEGTGRGIIAGNQVIDVKATVYFGKYHPVDSDEFSFKMAGSLGFREACKAAKPVILEPIYDVDIKVPQENMGDVMGDISSRRGKVASMEVQGKWQIIHAKVPLAELYKYANTLRSMTSGRGTHRRKFSHYEEVPGDIQAKLVEEYEAKKAEGN